MPNWRRLSAKHIAILNKLFNFVWFQFFIFIFFLFYIMIGTYLFILIERPAWWRARDENWKWRDETVGELWKVLDTKNISRKTWRLEFLDKISGTYSAQDNFCALCVWLDEELCVNPWLLEKTISYCTGLCLTLGYGGMAPVSKLGIILTATFAVMGMTQMVYILGTCGNILSTASSKAWTYAVRFYYTGIYYKTENEVKRKKIPVVYHTRKIEWLLRAMTISKGSEVEHWEKVHIEAVDDKMIAAEEDTFVASFPLWLMLLILASYILMGELLIGSEMSIYGWDYVESTYYHINLFTTIGFVDLPLQDEIGVLYSHMYLFGGFLLLSMLYGIVQNLFSAAKPTFLQLEE